MACAGVTSKSPASPEAGPRSRSTARRPSLPLGWALLTLRSRFPTPPSRRSRKLSSKVELGENQVVSRFSSLPSRVHHFPVPLYNPPRSEEHTSELQSQSNLVCRLLLEK